MSESEKGRKLKRLASGKVDFQERLLKGEKIVEQARINPAIYWQSVCVFILAVLVGLFVVKELGLLLVVVAGLMAFYAFIKKSILLLVVTNKRILVRYGILQVDVVDIHFDKVESVELERMLTGYIMGYSNVIIMGTGNRFMVIPYVANGVEIRRAYNELVLGDGEE
ncbi:MAG: PH domain-containing protein [Alphaproteobacteria bacterium]|nr:PH domain-containing protein [Alphaproteobacteria bacterium]